MADGYSPADADRLRSRLASRLRVLDELLNSEMEEYFSSPGAHGGILDARTQLRRYVEVASRLIDSLAEKEGQLDTVLMDVPVTVVDEADGSRDVFVVVGPDEGDLSQGRISCLSPRGLSLLLKRVEERVVFEAPGGRFIYRIEAVGNRA